MRAFLENAACTLTYRKGGLRSYAKTQYSAQAKCVPSALRYTPLSSGLATAEFPYQPHGWSHRYRFVVIRRPKPDERTDQLPLFPLGRHIDQVFVTNLDLWPLTLWRLYNHCAAVELIIKRGQGRLPLGLNSHQTFRGRRGPLPHPPVRPQPDQLVQTAVLATEPPIHGLAIPTHSTAADSWRADPAGQSPAPEIARQFSPPGGWQCALKKIHRSNSWAVFTPGSG